MSTRKTIQWASAMLGIALAVAIVRGFGWAGAYAGVTELAFYVALVVGVTLLASAILRRRSA